MKLNLINKKIIILIVVLIFLYTILYKTQLCRYVSYLNHSSTEEDSCLEIEKIIKFAGSSQTLDNYSNYTYLHDFQQLHNNKSNVKLIELQLKQQDEVEVSDFIYEGYIYYKFYVNYVRKIDTGGIIYHKYTSSDARLDFDDYVNFDTFFIYNQAFNYSELGIKGWNPRIYKAYIFNNLKKKYLLLNIIDMDAMMTHLKRCVLLIFDITSEQKVIPLISKGNRLFMFLSEPSFIGDFNGDSLVDIFSYLWEQQRLIIYTINGNKLELNREMYLVINTKNDTIELDLDKSNWPFKIKKDTIKDFNYYDNGFIYNDYSTFHFSTK